MKLVIDEKLKHRVVGVAVIISLGAIFLPAIMKKSSQRLENNFSVQVKLPPKPVSPNVVMTDEKEMFKTIKVASIKASSIAVEKANASVKNERLQEAHQSDPRMKVAAVVRKPEIKAVAKPIELALNNAAENKVKKQTKVVAHVPAVKKVVTVAQANQAPVTKKEIYAVQVASFSQRNNAELLVNKLHQKGYKANYVRTATRKGAIYKVYAGHSPVKNEVVKVKTQLASAMRLHGFVVNTGVS